MKYGPVFDPVTLWRIPEDVGVKPVEPLARKIRDSEVKLLNARRAGHRGKGRGQIKQGCEDGTHQARPDFAL
jgi:hypothetical protein